MSLFLWCPCDLELHLSRLPEWMSAVGRSVQLCCSVTPGIIWLMTHLFSPCPLVALSLTGRGVSYERDGVQETSGEPDSPKKEVSNLPIAGEGQDSGQGGMLNTGGSNTC